MNNRVKVIIHMSLNLIRPDQVIEHDPEQWPWSGMIWIIENGIKEYWQGHSIIGGLMFNVNRIMVK